MVAATLPFQSLLDSPSDELIRIGAGPHRDSLKHPQLSADEEDQCLAAIDILAGLKSVTHLIRILRRTRWLTPFDRAFDYAVALGDMGELGAILRLLYDTYQREGCSNANARRFAQAMRVFETRGYSITPILEPEQLADMLRICEIDHVQF